MESTKDLRNKNQALLRRLQRQVDKAHKEKEEKYNQISKKEFKPFFMDSLGCEIEDSLIFPEKKKQMTRLSLYNSRGGRR